MPRSRALTEEMTEWKDKIHTADQLKQNYLHKNWARTLANWEGEYYTGAKPGDVSNPVNVVQALAGVIVPSVYFRDPTIRVKAVIPGTELLCQFREARQNYLIRRTKLKRQVRRFILDNFLFGVGHLKVGYEVKVERAYEPVMDPSTGGPMLDVYGNPVLTDKTGALYIERGGRVTLLQEADGYGAPPGRDYPRLNEYIEYEYPYAVRWSPYDVLKDPFSLMSDNSDAQWVAFRSSMAVEEVQEHPYWENTKDVKATQEPDYVRTLRRRNDFQGLAEENRVLVYEIYCKEYDKKTDSYRQYMKVVAEGHHEFLFYDPSPLAVRGFPLVSMSFIDNPESPYPISPVDVVRPQIDHINITRTLQANHRERFANKYIANKTAGITERDAVRFARAGSAAVLLVKMSEEADPQKAFRAVEVPVQDPAIAMSVEELWRDIQRIDGINEHHLGGAGIARQATQANFIESALGVRLNFRQDLVADALLELMGKWTDLDRQYGDYEATYKTTGVDGETWQTFKVSEAIPDDFDLYADMNIAAFQAAETEKKEMLELLNLTANLPEINRQPILERLFRVYGFPTPEMLIRPVMPPIPGMEQDPTGSLSESAVDSSSANRALNDQARATNQQG